jgi:hypothetical protein
MSTDTAPNHLSLAAQLPAGAYYYLMQSLRRMLPLLRNDTPEDRVRRNQSAMARVAALCPANIAEAEVASLHVAHAEHAKACLFDAQHPELSLRDVLRCRAQAASMSRQSDSSLRMLLRMQAARQKIEANPEARDRAAWTEHCALNLMAQALSPPPTIPEPPPPPHLSRPAGEVATQSVAAEGATGEAQLPQPEPEPVARPSSPCGRVEPRSRSMGEGAIPAKPQTPNQDRVVSPQTDAKVRPMHPFAHLSDDDLMHAILTAFKPASVT